MSCAPPWPTRNSSASEFIVQRRISAIGAARHDRAIPGGLDRDAVLKNANADRADAMAVECTITNDRAALARGSLGLPGWPAIAAGDLGDTLWLWRPQRAGSR